MKNTKPTAPNTEALIEWKTNAWKDASMVAWYSQRMVENTGTMRLHNLLETSLCERFAVGESILDVGVGTGRASLPLARKGFKLTGVDSSQAMLDECRRLAGGTPVELRQGDVLDLPVDDDSFDTVMALNVMTHFPHWRDVLGEWKKKVRSGGRILFDVYSLDHWERVSGRPMSEAEIIAAHDFGQYNTHIKVEDLVACADELGLSIVAVVPYGGLYSGKQRYPFSGRPLNELNWWQRHLSWIASDDRFFDFCLFLERNFFGCMTSLMTGRFMAVLEKRPDHDGNRQWLERNRRTNELLQGGLSEELLAFARPDADMGAWKDEFNRHLDYLRNRVMFLFLWLSVWNKTEVFDGSLLEARHREVLDDWKSREQMDARAFSLAQGWHQQAEIARALDFHDLPLGIGLEYEMTRALLKDGCRAFA